jgi:NOL1/NOP2/fmu family ribosome biogenesis protein
MPIASSLKERIKESYPDAEASIYHSDKWNVIEIETEKRDEFKKWVDGNDAFILLVGD